MKCEMFQKSEGLLAVAEDGEGLAQNRRIESTV